MAEHFCIFADWKINSTYTFFHIAVSTSVYEVRYFISLQLRCSWSWMWFLARFLHCIKAHLHLPKCSNTYFILVIYLIEKFSVVNCTPSMIFVAPKFPFPRFKFQTFLKKISKMFGDAYQWNLQLDISSIFFSSFKTKIACKLS